MYDNMTSDLSNSIHLGLQNVDPRILLAEIHPIREVRIEAEIMVPDQLCSSFAIRFGHLVPRISVLGSKEDLHRLVTICNASGDQIGDLFGHATMRTPFHSLCLHLIRIVVKLFDLIAQTISLASCKAM